MAIACTPAGLAVEVTDDGTGLRAVGPPGHGLAIMRERAEELGGTVTIQDGSWRHGQGKAASRDRARACSRRPGGARMTRVLIVDDHPVFRDGLAGLLATLPEVVVAGTAGTAEKAA